MKITGDYIWRAICIASIYLLGAHGSEAQSSELSIDNPYQHVEWDNVHHSTTDAPTLHFNALGSHYSTGYGRRHRSSFDVDWDKSPFEYTFHDLNIFDSHEEHPGAGVYRLDRRLAPEGPASGTGDIVLSILGVEECDPLAVTVTAAGNDSRHRPNVQIRFHTEQGLAKVIDEQQARFPLPTAADGSSDCDYIRVEAFAYPDTHHGDEPLEGRALQQMSLDEIALLHKFTDEDNDESVGVVSMLFSQPIRFARSQNKDSK